MEASSVDRGCGRHQLAAPGGGALIWARGPAGHVHTEGPICAEGRGSTPPICLTALGTVSVSVGLRRSWLSDPAAVSHPAPPPFPPPWPPANEVYPANELEHGDDGQRHHDVIEHGDRAAGDWRAVVRGSGWW
ncbi:hypothetical protein AAFF_G00132500 [Aldrovandia affinis]|uniref:Uncharacterized protein n=1 Tax=Aldrovandia affinis TaxID=143900 RepID=A0AAD7RT37_9TELE|nr:hypothetical protein AAFF_G00132500 [Aldrovandia affinis]